MTQHRALRNRGVEDPNFTPKGSAGNTKKLSNSISRTRSKVFELAECNTWELFVTFTLNPQKYERHDLKKFIKDLSHFIRNYKASKGTDIKYLLIPEQHQDGAWHMHGFLKGLPIDHLTPFRKSDRIPKKIRTRLEKGIPVFTWTTYVERFGFADIEVIENPEAVSKYITKYITEDLGRAVCDLNAHMYYCSKGLQKAELLLVAPMYRELQNPDYENEHVRVKNCHSYEEAEACVL